MHRRLAFAVIAMAILAVAGVELAATRRPATAAEVAAAQAAPSLTIYNQNFAVVRQLLPLDIGQGVTPVRFTETTAHLEPDSVILRDPTGRRRLSVLEQNYRADAVTQELLLSLYEGKELDFELPRGEGRLEIVRGKVIRSGYVPHTAALRRYGQPYYQAQMQYATATQPIIEVEGQLIFGLPGRPRFPALTGDTILKPTLHWQLATDQPGSFPAELSYVTGGLSWQADYNVVAREGGQLELVGWVTMDNQSGKTFEQASIKLMAGDVHKLQPGMAGPAYAAKDAMARSEAAMQPAVTQRSFDEYHLYTLERAVTLRDRETKQVEFLRAGGVRSQKLYVYDGAFIDPNRYMGYSFENIIHDRNYGTQSNPKVWVMREFRNGRANGLGVPLPRGRVRFYQRDEKAGGALEFTGENFLDHTPEDETVRLYTGNAFDLVGERKRTNYVVNTDQNWADESFEIRVRNHKSEPVEVRVVEHLYRWVNWQIRQPSTSYDKKDAQTIEYRVLVPAKGERVVSYTVHYSW